MEFPVQIGLKCPRVPLSPCRYNILPAQLFRSPCILQRTVDEPEVEQFSSTENSELFDEVSAQLAETARKAKRKGLESKEWSIIKSLWENVVGEGGPG